MRKNTVFRIVIIAAIVITAAVVIVMFCRTLILTDAGETPAQDSSTEDQNSKLSRYDDGDGFCIKDGVLLAYIGSASEVEVPGDVTEIGEDAFSSDMRMLEILERITRGEGQDGDIEKLEELAGKIKDGAMCGLGQTAPNPVLTTLRYFRNEYEDHIYNHKCTARSWNRINCSCDLRQIY